MAGVARESHDFSRGSVNKPKAKSTVYWDDDVKKALQEHIARKIALGESAHGAVSQLVNEALRMILCLPMPEKEGEEDE